MSEHILQSELDLAIWQSRARYHAESSSPQSTPGIGKLWRVERIKELASEEHLVPFCIGHLE